MDSWEEKFDEVVEFRQSLTSETDRGCALMAAAYLDSEIGKLLDKYFVSNNKVKEEILGNSRPLGTFSAKIDIAYLLGFIGPKAHRDLHLIRKIRNDFGHVPTPMDFNDQSMAARCREFYHDAFDNSIPPRQKFTRVVLGVLAVLHSELLRANTIEESKDLNIDDETKERHRKLLKILEGNADA
ncbi:MAG: transcriptional regulator [Acidobacteriota bacterium]